MTRGIAGGDTSPHRRSISTILAILLVAGCGASPAGSASTDVVGSERSPLPTAGPTQSAIPTSPVEPTASVSPIGQMTVERGYHAATLLADGRVLILGGYSNNREAPTAVDVFDPASGAFSATGPMTGPRSRGPAATTLADGRVLVTGGTDGFSRSLASAELYDPATGLFTPTGSMTDGRIYHRATRLLDGRVLVTGGDDTTGGLASAELYDPAIGTFSPTGPMKAIRTAHSATLLDDGRVLIAGGTSNMTGAIEGPGPCLTSAEIYDPSVGTFSETGPMVDPRCGHAAVRLDDGQVLVMGGGTFYGDPRSVVTADVYDPATNAFTPAGPMTEARIGQIAVLLPDGRVLVAGGNDAAFQPMVSAEIYDPAADTFSPTGLMTDPRAWFAATALLDGRVLVTGGSRVGWTYSGPFNDTGEIYDPTTGMFGPTMKGG